MTVPKDVRSNANFIIGFYQAKDDSDWFYNNVLSRYMDREEFKRLATKQWKQYKRWSFRLHSCKFRNWKYLYRSI